MPKPPNLFEYVGAVHIHTKDSDGSKTHREIIRIADRYHLDFLLFTDHMTMAHKDSEGWYGRLLVIVGYEIQDPDDLNHYLVFGLDEVLPAGLTASEYVREVRDRGGIGIIAHPDEVRDIEEVSAYPWTSWDVDIFDGIEIWNQMSSWLEGLEKHSRLKSFLHPRSILGTPSPETLAHWDSAAEKRRVLGIGSLDAHGARYRIGPFRLTLFPYKVQFQAIRTHVLFESPLPTDDFAAAQKAFFRALKRAHVFISNQRWGNARGFRFWCESKKQVAIVGESMRFHPSIVFKVSSPEAGTIRLVYKGKVVSAVEGSEAQFPVRGAGSYRVEVLKGEKGWIYSNHIKILPGGRRGSRPKREQKNREAPQKERRGDEKPAPKSNSSRRRRRPRNRPPRTEK